MAPRLIQPSSGGAACFFGQDQSIDNWGGTENYRSHSMSLLRSLDGLGGARYYKHGAPDGACAVDSSAIVSALWPGSSTCHTTNDTSSNRWIRNSSFVAARNSVRSA